MPSLADVRAQFPQYQDLSDQQLADGMHKKFYSDMPRAEFDTKIGFRVAPKTFAENVAEPITSYLPTQKSIMNEGVAAMGRGASQIGELMVAGGGKSFGEQTPEELRALAAAPANLGKGIGNMASGALGALASPITAAYRTLLGAPVEKTTGIPKEYTEFAAQLLTPGLGLTRLGTASGVVETGKKLVTVPKNEVASAGARIGVEVPRAVASDSRIVQATGAGARNVPFAGEPLMKAAEKTIDDLGGAVQTAAASGGGASVERAGDIASRNIQGWIKGESGALTKKAYDAVDGAVDAKVTTDLGKTREIVADILARRQNAAIGTDSKAVNSVIDGVQRPGGLNYQGVKDLRSSIGEQLNGGILPEGMSGAELKRIYGALTDDLRSAVEAGGGARGAALWERANKLHGLVSDRRENLSRLVGASGDAPPALVFERLKVAAGSKSRADTELLAQARKTMGEDWQEVVSGVVGQLGKNAKNEFSPQIFLNNWASMSESGKNLMFAGSGNLRQSLEDIATVSGRFNQLQKYANPSGTGRQAFFGAGAAGGAFVDPLTTFGTVLGANVLSRVLASPASASSMSKWVKTYEVVAHNQSPSSVAALGRASRNFGATISSELKLPNPANDLMNAIGPRRSAASDSQQ